jgi:hypothetical protein
MALCLKQGGWRVKGARPQKGQKSLKGRACASGEAHAQGGEERSVCRVCGISLDEAPNNCENGAVAGGLGAIPYVRDVVPIKSWRQCPAAAKRGVRYRRRGQNNDGAPPHIGAPPNAVLVIARSYSVCLATAHQRFSAGSQTAMCSYT